MGMVLRIAGILLGASLMAAFFVLVWALSPTTGARVWHDEIDVYRYRALATLATPRPRQSLLADLAIIDPAGLLGGNLRWQDAGVAFRDTVDGESIAFNIPLGPPPQRPREGGGQKPLDGLRIVVDPGHHGGAWSRVERRYFTSPGTDGVVREGDLNYAVARLLAEKLERHGASVTLTREAPPRSPFPAGTHVAYDEADEAALLLAQKMAQGYHLFWRNLYPARVAYWRLLRVRAAFVQEFPFALYGRFDLRQRSRDAARLRPHLTLSIHHNIAKNPRLNGIVVFVPGNFMFGELRLPSSRFYAVRRLLEGRLDDTIATARAIGWAMQNALQLPPLPYVRASNPGLDKKLAVDPEAGVFARNLALLRRTPGPVLLLEGPCMNHPAEFARYQQQEVAVDGVLYSRRVEAYAEGVFRGVVASADSLRR